MRDIIGDLKQKTNDIKSNLLKACDPNNQLNLEPFANKYSPEQILRIYQNHSGNMPHNVQSYANKMMRSYSRYRQAKNDPDKYNAHIMNNSNNNVLYKRIINSINSGKRNDPNSNPKDGVIPNMSNNEDYKLAMDVINEANDVKRLKPYDRYTQWNGNQPFNMNEKLMQTYGKEFYFPNNFNYLKQLQYVTNYLKLKNNYNADKQFTNNTYHHLYDSTMDYNWLPKNTNGGQSDAFTRKANNALGKYQYVTYKDMIWQQYYQHKLKNWRFIKSSVHINRRKIQAKINRLCHYRGKYYADTGSWNDHHLIPDKSRVNEIDRLAQERNETDKYINKPVHSRLRNYYEKQLTKYNNLINHRKDNFANQQDREIHHYIDLGNIYNIKHDTRYTHFGYIQPRNPNSDHSYVYFMITDESPTYETQVSSTPVEWGVNMTTGTQKQQTQVQVEGILFNPKFSTMSLNNGQYKDNDTANYSDVSKNLFSPVLKQSETLSSWQNRGAEMSFSGKESYPHCIISEFNPDYNNSGDGGSETSCNFSMTLTLSDYFSSNVHTQRGRSHHHGRKGRNKGKNNSNWKYIRAKAGYTYWGIGIKKGIPVSNLERWNKWPARRIPIGAEIRYKPNHKHGRKRIHTTHRKYHRK